MPNDQLLTFAEAAEMLGYHPTYVRHLASKGLIPSTKFGPKKVRFRKSQLEAFIASRIVERGVQS